MRVTPSATSKSISLNECFELYPTLPKDLIEDVYFHFEDPQMDILVTQLSSLLNSSQASLHNTQETRMGLDTTIKDSKPFWKGMTQKWKQFQSKPFGSTSLAASDTLVHSHTNVFKTSSKLVRDSAITLSSNPSSSNCSFTPRTSSISIPPSSSETRIILACSPLHQITYALENKFSADETMYTVSLH